jgi:hypothetical protein
MVLEEEFCHVGVFSARLCSPVTAAGWLAVGNGRSEVAAM